MDIDLSVPRWVLLAGVGAAVAAVGSVLPWATLRIDSDVAELMNEPTTQTIGGLDGDGMITLALAVLVLAVLAAVVYRSHPGPKTAVFTVLTGALVSLVAYVDYTSMQDARRQIQQRAAGSGPEAMAADAFSLEIGPALYVIAVGGVLLLATGGYGLVSYWRTRSGTATAAAE